MKLGRDPARLVVRHSYGALFTPATVDDLEDDELETDEDEEDTRGRSKKRTELSADQPLLAVLIAIYDSKAGDSFEPVIRYSVMDDWMVGPAKEKTFSLAPKMLKAIPLALASSEGTPKGGRITTNAVTMRKGRAKSMPRLSCRLPGGIKSEPLFSLSDSDALERLAQQMKKMWAKANEGP